MLKKENRIRKEGDFSRVFKFTRPVYSGNLAIRVSGRTNNSQPRFGFIISNKIDKRATRRNKLKRFLRNAAQAVLNDIKPGVDIVVIVKSNFPYPYKKDEVEEQFLAGLKRAGILT